MSLSRGERRLLLFSYAFPPLAVPMASYVAKAMAGCAAHGYAVDVVAAAPFHPQMGRDDSLDTYVERHFASVTRLRPLPVLSWPRLHSRRWATIPDPMQILEGRAMRHLARLPLEDYAAIVTFSPFHSVNPVMCRLKQERPGIRWIAEFGDPWARNPLETSQLRERWNRRHEPETVRLADRLLFSARTARDLMLEGHPAVLQEKTAILPHCWDPELYPSSGNRTDGVIRLRHIGTLFGQRSPEQLFRGLHLLLARRPELRDRLVLDLIGIMPPEMLETAAARALPPNLVRAAGMVDYRRSLALMREADILILIEPELRQNLFVPSKLTDYLGAGRPIVALAPPGASRDRLVEMRAWHASPADPAAIAEQLDAAIRRVESGAADNWFDAEIRDRLRNTIVARQLLDIVEELAEAGAPVSP